MDDEEQHREGVPPIGSGAYIVLLLVLIVGVAVTVSLVPSVFNLSWPK